MSHDYSAINNKQQKRSKVRFEQYLYNAAEPADDMASDSPRENEAELLEDSFSMRRSFRDMAHKMRNRYS